MWDRCRREGSTSLNRKEEKVGVSSVWCCRELGGLLCLMLGACISVLLSGHRL